jgi:hypothetical protein
MVFAPIEWTIDEKMFNRFDYDTLTVWANRGIGLANVKEVLI